MPGDGISKAAFSTHRPCCVADRSIDKAMGKKAWSSQNRASTTVTVKHETRHAWQASVTSRGRNEDEPPFRYWLVAPFASHSSIPSFPSLSSNHHPRTLHQSPVFCPSSSVSPYLSPGSRRLSRCTAELAICRPLLSCPCVAPIFSDPILRFPQCPSGLNRCGIRRKTCVHGLHRTRCEMLAIMMVTRMVKISHACCKHLDMVCDLSAVFSCPDQCPRSARLFVQFASL